MSLMLRTSLCAIPVMIAYLVSLEKPFFWDTMHLASIQAQWLYNQQFSTLLIPDGYDSGHPPLTGLLLATTWSLLGKGLCQSHLLMLPFILLMITQASAVMIRYFGDKAPLVAIPFFLNPILVAQSMLVSPDLILYAAFFLTWAGIVNGQRGRIASGALLLAMVSMRGMMCVAALGIFHAIQAGAFRGGWQGLLKWIGPYLPAAVTAAGFLIYHYNAKGWIGYHAGSPWAPSFEAAGVDGILKNIIILAWRCMDQGMLFYWLVPLLLLRRKKITGSNTTRGLLSLLPVIVLFLVLPQLWYKSLLMHRYLLPLVAVLYFLVMSLVINGGIDLKRTITWITPLLLSGYCWVYPDTIAKGWDAMPFHISYYRRRFPLQRAGNRDRPFHRQLPFC